MHVACGANRMIFAMLYRARAWHQYDVRFEVGRNVWGGLLPAIDRYCGKKHEFDSGHGMHGASRSSGRGGRESRRRRMFNAGELSLILLHLMQAESRHGYDLIREMASRTGGAYAPSSGIVYPTLSLLEEAGEIEAVASEGAKCLFAITSAGRARLDEHRVLIEAALARRRAQRCRRPDRLRAGGASHYNIVNRRGI